ncbi:MAG: hypothetical protein MJ078_07640, partial [Clostridia bacterium]|nr:hypothetical protein [Clostridia bacterium]
SYVAQPGGSIRDSEVTAAADKYGMVMAFTGLRLFHHYKRKSGSPNRPAGVAFCLTYTADTLQKVKPGTLPDAVL